MNRDTNGIFYKNTVIVSLIDGMIPLVDVWMGPILSICMSILIHFIDT